MRKYSRTELDTLSAEEAADKAKDDEVRRLIRNAQYDDAGRLVLYYYRDTLINVVAATLIERYTPRRHRKQRMLQFGSSGAWEDYLNDYFALDELAEVFRKCSDGTERVVVVIASEIRARIKNTTDEYDIYDFALAVHCLPSRQSFAFLGEQAGEQGVNRYSLMEARRGLAVLRKACKDAPDKYPEVSRSTAVRWLCFCFGTGV